MESATPIRIGTAGWSVPKAVADRFPGAGTHLERYARALPCVEINSSFYRPHKPETYARWAASAPAGFRFAVKVPKAITHVRRLNNAADLLDRFLGEAGELGDRLGPLLVQLPPSGRFDPDVASAFFEELRARFDGDVVCEPRHASWFTGPAGRLLVEHRVARVAADPAPVPEAADPGGWDGLLYWRLHGSPEIYHSPYPPAELERVAATLAAEAARRPAWCIFDNTALGHATADALTVLSRLTARLAG
ncbi:DUF72 domain-containing protein [Azospirillum sp. TSO22-1]|uniref:DUF72 domain-containing protein n=1 Tax=Azospirillum sp. TSO22-1 TaxID=716789 RepID=UPI000D6046E0|nr:DUF72 domain-containing protein [Azospirillum sp. TSO22-1]PWC45699.1 hypothetical protein TSO221_16135 [Azospirillum sp. TSO22-1]